jgi:zinc transport system substrate-binding protein
VQNISNMLNGLSLLTILLLSGANFAFSNNDNNRFIPVRSNVNTPKIKVIASFFPIYEFVREVGGNKVDVSVLIPLGVEPHDFDPTIQQIQSVESPAILVYNGAGMEGAWINKVGPKFAIDTSKGLNILTSNDPKVHAPTNPRIWLDPILAIQQVENIRDGLSRVDPDNAAYYD